MSTEKIFGNQYKYAKGCRKCGKELTPNVAISVYRYNDIGRLWAGDYCNTECAHADLGGALIERIEPKAGA